MILALAYHHGDAKQALKLLSWIVYLSARASGEMKKVDLHLTASKGVSAGTIHQQIVQVAEKHFKTVAVRVPLTEHETGWPGAPNFMFKETLEGAGGDMFFLEPDSIPVKAEWWKKLNEEWDRVKATGKVFMGGRVTTVEEHMTGVGVYGKEWREAAPKLLEVVEDRGWDLHAAKEIVRHAHFTKLIQHVFRGPPVLTIGAVNADAVIYHQDKEGRLINLLAQKDGRADLVKLFDDLDTQEEVKMGQKFYLTDNQGRKSRSQGLEFTFEQVDMIGGVPRGVFSTEIEAEQIALDALVGQGVIQELEPERYHALVQKKTPRQRGFHRSAHEPKLNGLTIKESPAAVVAVATPSKPKEPGLVNVIENLESILEIGYVKPLEPIQNMKPKRRR